MRGLPSGGKAASGRRQTDAAQSECTDMRHGLAPLADALISPSIGDEAYALAARLFPIFRSMTGNGVRETLRVLGGHIALEQHEVPTGTEVFDWTVPKEWNVREAWIEDSRGRRFADIGQSNLHLVHYSVPVDRIVERAELLQHIHTLPGQPDLIPYRTAYHAETWGFCLAHRDLSLLEGDRFRVRIDSTLGPGSLTYGEYLHQGDTDEEMLLSAHICHPSLANDNCAGLAILTLLAAALKDRRTRLSYRFIFAPGTIGAITWLSRNRDKISRIKHGLAVSCLGDGAGPVYKQSRDGGAPVDRAAAHVLATTFETGRVIGFSPYGYDERQYGSPGFNLPVGLLQRSAFAEFPEYHTSGDNLDFIRPGHMGTSFGAIVRIIEALENDVKLINLSPYGEPQLGRRGLYASVGGDPKAYAKNMATLWVLNQSDGTKSLLDIAIRAGLPFGDILAAAIALENAGLVDAAS